MSKPSAERLPDPSELRVSRSIAAAVRPPVVARHLDRPETVGPINDDLMLSGWVLGRDEPIAAVEVIADGRRLGRVRLEIDRPDVAEAHPDLEHAERCGFRLRVPRPMAAGLHELELRANVGGRAAVPFWTITLGASPAPPTGQPVARSRPWSRRRAPQRAAALARRPTPPVLDDPFRVVALISTYNEADIIESVLDHLADNGVWVYVIDNGSTDGTLDALRPRLGMGVLGMESLPTRDGQVAWRDVLARKVALAKELGADWYLHHDADEIRESPWPGVTLRDAIRTVDRLGYNAIDFRVLNFPPVDDGFRAGDDPRTYFERWADPAEYDRMQRKGWRGGVADLALEDGGHDVRFAGRRLFPLRFLLRHYPIRSQAHGTRKVLKERKDRFVSAEIEYGWHRQYDHVTGPDHLFLQNPAELKAFDLDRVRLETMLEDGANATSEADAEAARGTLAVTARGVLDRVTTRDIAGWAVVGEGEPATVDLWDGAERIATVRAEQPRADLAERGISDGRGGFVVRTPPQLLDGRPHWIWATEATTGMALRQAPTVLYPEQASSPAGEPGPATGATV